ncbi:MAG: serine hydrolase [Clostridia bacterium]|nr:serine hydrolase [Clostridia bacterium]
MNLSAVNRSLTLLMRLFDPSRATQPFLAPQKGKPAFSPTVSSAPLPRATPEQMGVDSARIAEFLYALSRDPLLRMHSVTVLRHGSVICEAGFGAQDRALPKYTFSECKTLVALAIGILCDRGLLSEDDRIVDLFSDRINPVQKLRLSELTVAHLLSMRSGVVFNELESQTDEDWVKCFLNSSLSAEPGKTFHYNSMNSYLLSAIVCRKTNMTLSAFLQQNLFDALDIRNYHWDTCPAGIEIGGWGLYMAQEDMAKLGLLVLQGGRYGGRQLISEAFIRRATDIQTVTPAETGRYDYGYQMWTAKEPRAFLFNGVFGQNVLGFPDSDILVVSNAGNDELFQQSPYYDTVTNAFGDPTSFSDQPLPHNPVSQAYLSLAVTEIGEHSDTALRTAAEAYQRAQQAMSLCTQDEAPEKELPSVFSKFFSALGWRGHRGSAKTTAIPVSATQKGDGRSAHAQPQCSRLDAAASLFLDKEFCAAEDEATASVGLLPVVMQAVQGNYTRGFVSISFEKTVDNGEECMLVTYRENDDTHVFCAGVHRSMRTLLYFHGTPFWVAARCTFPTDEDGRPVCKLECAFLETPCTKTVKLFLCADGSVILRQDEKPGDSLVCRAVLSQKKQLLTQKIIGPAMEKIDNEYLAYRIRRTFSPSLLLREKKK